MKKGIPDPACKEIDPSLENYTCECSAQNKTHVTFSMLYHQVIAEVGYCNCRSLVNELIKNQFMPTSTKNPRNAIHFAVFDEFHLYKMKGHVSNHSFVKTYNRGNRYRSETPGSFKPMTMNNLNTLYWVYRKMVRRSEDHIKKLFDLNLVAYCLGYLVSFN
jgi:hypothetical protein